MLTIEEAFRQGMASLRAKGLPLTGKEIAVIVAHGLFEKAARDKQQDERFPIQGPQYAAKLILECLAH